MGKLLRLLSFLPEVGEAVNEQLIHRDRTWWLLQTTSAPFGSDDSPNCIGYGNVPEDLQDVSSSEIRRSKKDFNEALETNVSLKSKENWLAVSCPVARISNELMTVVK